MPNRTRLQNWPAFLKNGNQGVQFGLRDRKRRALDRGNPLPRAAKVKVLDCRDDNAGCTVDLPQEFVVYEDAAVLGRYQVRPAASGHPDLDSATCNERRNLLDGIVLANLAFFQLRNPDPA